MVKDALGASHRDAIAMIELIFAIVIMGIVLMSAPMLISRANKSNMVAFQQESIAILSSHVNALTSYAWDQQNTVANQERYLLAVADGDDDLNQTAVDTVRGATSTKSPPTRRKRRFSSISGAIGASAIGHDVAGNNDFNDIDDFNGTTRSLLLYTPTANVANKGEYIDQNITINTRVGYISDKTSGTNTYTDATFTFNLPPGVGVVNPSTNIKHIVTTLTSNSSDSEIADKQIVLHAFMCNIGAAAPLTLSMPIKSGI